MTRVEQPPNPQMQRTGPAGRAPTADLDMSNAFGAQRDRRYQIFVSSTFHDLAEERKKTIEVIFERGHIPIALERFSAANEQDREVIAKAIADCQVYILILGHRYGELVPGTDISFTELEYRIAQEHNLLILAFVLHREERERRIKQLDPKVSAEQREMLNYERLERFYASIDRFKQVWRPGDDFKFLVLKALDDNLPGCTKAGWIREPEESLRDLELAARNEFIGDIARQLKSFDKLYVRCLQYTEEKKALARFFREAYQDRLLKNNVSLFFESGSTVAYIARELAPALAQAVSVDETGKPSIQVSTNNVLAYLELWLKWRVPCAPFPWSPPAEETYGASYAGIEKLIIINPDYALTPLDDAARSEIRRLCGLMYSPPKWNRPALLLGAASGLQIGPDHRLSFAEGLDATMQNELRDDASRCFGPIVASYHNKVFKRFMYATGLPIVIFLTSDKIDVEINVGEDYFILDSELTWERFCRDHPVAFCVSFEQSRRQELVRLFQDCGFDVNVGPKHSRISALMARNEAFKREFEATTTR